MEFFLKVLKAILVGWGTRKEEEEGFLIRGCKYLTVSQEESGERKKYTQEKAKDRVDLLNFISLSSEFLTETSFQEFS